jgi:hypothetical protein
MDFGKQPTCCHAGVVKTAKNSSLRGIAEGEEHLVRE